MCYALAVPNGFIVASNLPGAVAAMAFVSMAMPLLPREPAAAAVRQQVQAVLVGGTASLLLLWTYLVFSAVPHATVVFALGA